MEIIGIIIVLFLIILLPIVIFYPVPKQEVIVVDNKKPLSIVTPYQIRKLSPDLILKIYDNGEIFSISKDTGEHKSNLTHLLSIGELWLNY